jgi:nucleotide-binding universal stress UspA family protein
MKRILVPYDGSESAERALLFAIDPIARGSETEVHLLNVQEWPVIYTELMTTEDFKAFREKLIDKGTQLLTRATKTLAARKVPYQTHVRVGSIELAIIDVANRLCCEQIVMGTRGHGTVTSLMLGSIAKKVVHLAEVPVTLVK